MESKPLPDEVRKEKPSRWYLRIFTRHKLRYGIRWLLWTLYIGIAMQIVDELTEFLTAE